MDEIKMEREIKEMLHQCGDGLHAPDSMQARVKFALNNAPARKRHLWSKRFVAVAAVAAIAVTGAFAAGGMGGIFSEGWSDQRLDLSSTQAHLADAGVALTLPDKIGEYTFSYGSDVDTTAQNDMGETEKVSEVDATYTKNGAELNLSAHKSYTVFSEDEMENPVPATTAEVNGVTLTYRDAHYRFVPDDYEKSDEEKQQEKNGELVISYYGSDEVEDKMFQSVLWEQQARVKFALNNAPARKRHLWSKRFVAVAAVAAIAVTGAFAAGGMGGIFSEGWSDQRLDLSSTQAHLADAGVALTLPDKIGEYTFSYGSDVDTTAQNDMGETEKVSEVDATYTKNGAELNLSAHKSYTVFSEDEMENPVPATTAEVNGVTLTYRDAHYRFVPDDYEKSDEEKQQEKNGELVISYYGSDEVEDKMFQSVLWEQDGATYLISGYDTGLDAQTMFDMAAELVK